MDLVELLQEWLLKVTYDLLEICRLLGVLENHTRYAPWARCWFFALQNEVRRHLHHQVHYASCTYNSKKRKDDLEATLPRAVRDQMIGTHISKEKALAVWRQQKRYDVKPNLQTCIRHLLLRALTHGRFPWA